MDSRKRCLSPCESSNKAGKTDFHDAKLRLEQHFKEGKFDFYFVTNTLRRHPKLASEHCRYGSSPEEDLKATPLSLLLLLKETVSLLEVQTLYNLAPQAIHSAGHRHDKKEGPWANQHMFSMVPLYLACRQGCSDDIVEFLANCIDPCDNDPGSPIVRHLRDLFVSDCRYANDEAKGTCMLSQGVVKILLERYPCLLYSGGRCLLEDAIEAGYPVEAVTHIFQQSPSKEIAISNPLSFSGSPQKEHLKKVLQALKGASLTWIIRHSTSHQERQEEIQLLYFALGCDDGLKTTSISTLIILFYSRIRNDSARFVGVAKRLLCKLDHLEVLSIRRCCEHERRLFRIPGQFYPRIPPRRDPPEKTCVDLCRALGNHKTLRKFELDPPCIVVKKPVKVLAEAMKENYALESLSLINKGLMGGDFAFRDTMYYARLNGFGRLEARNPLTPITRFVKLLGSALEDYFEEPEAQHQILYGLLREAPGLWAPHCV